MKYRMLGTTDLQVSELGFGAWGIGGNRYGNSYGPTADDVSMAALRSAIDAGCTFIDTADVYGRGHSEELVGRFLREGDGRHGLVVATKAGTNFDGTEAHVDFSESHLLRAAEESLRRLGRDYLDLYQLHNPPVEVMRRGAAFAAMESLKKAGKIRYYGVSVHTVSEGLCALETGKPATIQVAHNLLSLSISANPIYGLFEKAARSGVGIIAREPLASGFLTGKHQADTRYGPGDVRGELPVATRQATVALVESLRFLATVEISLAQAALRFVMDEEHVSTTIVGVKTPEQAQENFRAAELPLFETLVARATEAEECLR